jgi:predicted DNA-binding transcriptional regulator YafY
MAKKKVQKPIFGKGNKTRERRYESHKTQIIKVFIMLSQRGYVRVKDIEQALEISERGAQRLIRPLKVQGMIVQDELDRGRWNFNREHYSFVKTHVSDHDAATLAFLYKFSKVFGGQISDSVLKSIDKFFVVEDEEYPYFVITSRVSQPDTELPFYNDLYKSIQQKNKILLTYESSGKDKTVKAWPMAFLMSDGMWYLCYLLEPEDGKDREIRTMRYGHIKGVKALEEEPFTRPDWVKNTLKEARNIWFNSNRCTKVLLEADNCIKDYFKLSEYFPLQKIVSEGPSTFQVECLICHELEVIPNIMRFIPYIRVIGPSKLRNKVREKVQQWLTD